MDRRGYLAPGVVVWAASGLDVDGLGAVVPAVLGLGAADQGMVVPAVLGPGLDVDGPNAGVLLLTLPTHSLPEQLCPLAALSLPPDLSFSQKSLPLLPELPPPS